MVLIISFMKALELEDEDDDEDVWQEDSSPLVGKNVTT